MAANVEPDKGSAGAARGLPHPSWLPDGREHKPRRGLNLAWVYPRSQDVLNECGMGTIAHYIGVRRNTILQYVVNCPIYEKCRAGVRGRGSAPRLWWWEQPMNLNDEDAGVGKLV